ncbi:MAG: hypothetical protein JOY78_08405, partial [Pseudonocardia sp.]|nr:hypothetical protein [Pseudonocardia sp.]
ATIGREFSVDLLREVSGRDDTTLQTDLRELVAAGLIWQSAESDADTYVFKHSLLRDAAYDLLPRDSRQTYHGRIAEALRGTLGSLAAGRNDLIALHLTNAGQHDDAVAFWAAAGHDALLHTANLEAAGHFRRAIECLRALPATPDRDARELELQSVLAPALFSIYGWASDEAERACRRARTLAIELSRPDRLYPALWGIWSVLFLRGQLAPALETAHAVREMADASGVPLFEVTAQHAVSFTRLFRGEFHEALQEADRGLALFDFDQEVALVAAFQLSSSVCLRQSRTQALWMLGRIEDADEESTRMLQLGRDLDQHVTLSGALAFALHAGGMRYSYSGEIGRLQGVAEELRKLCHEEGFFMWYAVAEIYLGMIDLQLGEPAAHSRITEGFELFAQTKTQVTSVMMKIIVAEQLCELGSGEDVEGFLDSAEAEVDERGERFYLPELWRVRGRLLARRGELSKAESAFREAFQLATAQEAHPLQLRAALDAYELLAATGRGEEGRDLVGQVLVDDDMLSTTDRPELIRVQTLLSRPLTESGTSDAG